MEVGKSLVSAVPETPPNDAELAAAVKSAAMTLPVLLPLPDGVAIMPHPKAAMQTPAMAARAPCLTFLATPAGPI